MSTIYFTAKITVWIMTAMLIVAGAMLYFVIFLLTFIFTALEWALRFVADYKESR